MSLLRFLALGWCALLGTGLAAAELRLGIIGLDTSHCIQFTRILNDPSQADHVPGARVVGAYKGGSPDIPNSANRVDGFTEQISQKYGVRLYDRIEDLAQAVDAILLLSLDGRVHLEQARRAFTAGKPVFIDKPMAASLRDVITIFRLAKQSGVPVFSTSSARYADGVDTIKNAPIGEWRSVVCYGPSPIESVFPDLFWYGIHTVEQLYAITGPGCQSVTRVHTPQADVVTGVWTNGRVGTVVGLREATRERGVTILGTKGDFSHKPKGGYAPLLRTILTFAQTRVSPLSSRETIELFAFMEAADESKRRGGAAVSLAEYIQAQGGYVD